AVRLPVALAAHPQGLPQFATGLTAHKKAALGSKLVVQPANQGSLSPMPAMKIAMSVLACALVLLAGCCVADQNAPFFPEGLLPPRTQPPPPNPPPPPTNYPPRPPYT